MLKGIDMNELVEYVSEKDTTDNKTIFYIGNINHRQKLKIFQGCSNPDGTVDSSKVQDKAIDIFLIGVKKIKNFNGQNIEPVTEEMINKIPFAIVIEIVGKIVEFNFGSEQELKN